MKVRIKSLPKSANGSQVNNKFQGKEINWPGFSNEGSDNITLKRTLAPVPRDKANVEAEKGEVAIADMNFDGIPEHFVVGGQRHSSGGTPLSLPADSFIFSDTQKMKIKDRDILDRFNMGKGSFTPADIAKKFNLNKYRQMLYDKDADKIQTDTAEMMIQNYNLKLGELALVQESKKGFPQSIPTIAMPYLETQGIDPSQLLPQQQQDEVPAQSYAKYGGIPKAQDGITGAGNFFKHHFFNDEIDLSQNNPHIRALTQFKNDLIAPGKLGANYGKYMQEYDAPIPGLNFSPDKLHEFTSKYPDIIVRYLKALQETEPDIIEDEADYISQQKGLTERLSWDWVPGSDADIIGENLPDILRERALKLRNQRKVENFYKNLEGRQDKAIEKIVKLQSEIAKLPAGSTDKITKKIELKYLQQQLTPGYLDRLMDSRAGFLETGDEEIDDSPGLVSETVQQQNAPVHVVEDTVPETDTVDYTQIYNYKYGGSVDLPKAQTGNVPKPGWNKGIDNQGKTIYRLYDNNLKIVKSSYTDPKPSAAKQTPAQTTTSPVSNRRSVDINPLAIDTKNWKYKGVTGVFDAEGHVIPGSLPEVQSRVSGKNVWGDESKINNKETKELWKEYFDKAGWDPEKDSDRTEDNVKDFQRYVNKYYTDKGLKPYFDDTENFLVDGYWGPATARVPLPIGKREEAIAKVEEEKAKIKEEAKIYNNPLPVQKDVPNEWWLQDKNNLGFAMSNLFGINRYTPWNAVPDNMYLDPTFYDPTRALAANSEMVNQGVQGAATFSNPQAFNANFSQLQGQGASHAADIVGNYADRNVSVANQANAANTAGYNQYSREKANLATNLFDKYAMMNQQFDNSKRQAKEQIVTALNQGYTNSGKTQALNSLFPNFNIDPSAGGPLYWTGNPASLQPSYVDEDAKISKFVETWKTHCPTCDESKIIDAYYRTNKDKTAENPNMQYAPYLGFPG